MRRLVILLLVTLMSFKAMSQSMATNARIDSLANAANYEEAKRLIEPLLQQGDAATRALWANRSAELTIMQGNLADAENELLKINTGNDPYIQAITKTNLGFLYLNKARNDLAMKNLGEALSLFQSTGKQNTLEGAKCLADLGLLYMSTGKLSQARENLLIALQIRQGLQGESSEAVAASYNDLGLAYAPTNIDEALSYYEKALAIYEKMHGQEHPKIAIASTNIGFMYKQLKLYGDAVNNFENAESIWKKIYPEGHPNQALALVNLGWTYEDMGDKKAAQAFYEKALNLYRKSYGDKHPAISFVLIRMGSVKLRDNLYTEALQNFQDAICANSPTFNRHDIAGNPKAVDYYNGKSMLYALQLKAEALEARHFGKTLRFDDLELALHTLQSCDTLIDDIRFNSSDENDKIELGIAANEVYEDGVRIAYSMSEISLHPARYLGVAFYFAEKSKSAVLQESIADAEAKSFAGIPPAMLEKENELKASIAQLAQKLAQKPGEAQERVLRDQAFRVNGQYENFIRQLEKDYPDYYNLKFNRVAPTITDLQQRASPDMAIVCYFVAEKNQRLYTFVITRKKFKAYNSTLPADFDKIIKGFNNSLFFMVPESYREAASSLAPVLLRGVPLSMKELIIIPSGRLGTIPFEALPTGKLPAPYDFSTGRFLVQRVGISYEFSAGLLLQKARPSASAQRRNIFLCAPIAFADKDNLDDLPGTEQEVNQIAELFSEGNLVAKHEDANEGLIKSGKLTDYQYLHFATHGVVDELSPELSRIFLQPTDTEDGNVFSGEIFNLKLNADLAVLSACQTGLGKYSKGEGVIGLSRALVYAGARNIMVSYWSVADASTAELMTDFYQNLLGQPIPDYRQALRQAKVKMISTRTYAAPYYWAPFVLIGF